MGGGGGALIVSYNILYVGSAHFWGFKILNFNILWGFQKNEYIWGYEAFVDILRGHCKTGLRFGVISVFS